MLNEKEKIMLENAFELYFSIMEDLKNEKDHEIRKVIQMELDIIKEEIDKLQSVLNGK